jgi:hypothetical protein
VDEGLGAGFWFKIIGLVIACGIGAALLFLLVNAAWYRWGGFGAMMFFFALLLGYAYIHDRREVKSYGSIDG